MMNRLCFLIIATLAACITGTPVVSTAQSQAGSFDQYLESEDIIILDDHFKIKVSGEKVYYMEVFIERAVQFKINTPRGISELDTIVLPEPLDETYIKHTTAIRRNIDQLENVKVDDFTAEIRKPDGRLVPAVIGATTSSERILTRRVGEAYRYHYAIGQLETGDILTVSYLLRFPFRNNWHRLFSTRIFFHGKYPKLKYQFVFSHPIELPTDTTVSIIQPSSMIESGPDRVYTWELENLPGCMDEPGIRPYIDLPYFIFSLKPYELMYQHYNSFKDEFVPLWYFLCFDRERQVAKAFMDNVSGVKDKENLALNKLAGKFVARAGADTTGFGRISIFQRWMADSVSYDNALAFYDNQENYLIARPGLDLVGQTLKDNGLEFVYASMILKMGMNFFTAYPADKRTGRISTRYFAPNFDNELLFAPILKNDILVFLLPKSDYNHLYAEELPFYYEDVPVMLINTYDLGGHKLNLFESARIAHTPGSSLKDNFRKTRCEVHIDLDHLTAHFRTSITLSGQYSTLGRHAYLGKPVDPGIPPAYQAVAWNVMPGIKSESCQVETSAEFPYKSVIHAEFSGKEAVSTTGKEYRIDISRWFPFAVPSGFDARYRFTDYYPDFSGSDAYAFMLEFNHPVTVMECPENISISNPAGSFIFNIQQISGSQVLITTQYAVTSQIIRKGDIGQLYSIFEAISRTPGTILVALKEE